MKPYNKNLKYNAIVIGVSAGGLQALSKLLPLLPKKFPAPILIVQHLASDSDDFLYKYLNQKCNLKIKEAEDKEYITNGTVYFAPPNYHLLIEKDKTLSLSVDEMVNYSRPSIDVLFLSAIDVYNDKLIGVVLTGANNDGAEGLKRIKENGGLTIVQNPSEAYVSIMPKSAIAACKVDYTLGLEEISELLIDIFFNNS